MRQVCTAYSNMGEETRSKQRNWMEVPTEWDENNDQTNEGTGVTTAVRLCDSISTNVLQTTHYAVVYRWHKVIQ